MQYDVPKNTAKWDHRTQSEEMGRGSGMVGDPVMDQVMIENTTKYTNTSLGFEICRVEAPKLSDMTVVWREATAPHTKAGSARKAWIYAKKQRSMEVVLLHN